MATPCYCCFSTKQERKIKRQTFSSKLDIALHELGMLSTITNSRKEYLDEKSKEISAHSLSGPSLCVVQMNSKFVTNFTFSQNSSASVDTESEEEKEGSGFAEKLAKNEKLGCRIKSRKMKNTRSRHYLYKPYDFPWRGKLEDSLKKVTLAASTSTPSESSGSSVIISRQDSGNKSNPGSPVKSQKTVNGAGCSIIRSRSLDDLEISRLELKDGCSNEAGRAEIDTVSQRISNLHVS